VYLPVGMVIPTVPTDPTVPISRFPVVAAAVVAGLRRNRPLEPSCFEA
jgi:hypothetical protein